MDEQIDIIKEINNDFFDIIIEYWQYLHENPELSFNEKNTSEFIAKQLKYNNFKVLEVSESNSVIGIIEGSKPGKTIGIRAELDALPIFEKTSLKFKSKHEGIMHACGHDIHMASLLGTALILNKLKSNIHGKIMLIFESGEEQIPGGALGIINSDIFKNAKPNAMLAFHILPELAAGKSGFCEGQYMASGDEIYIVVKGKGGHAALPNTTINPIILASKTLLDLKEFIDNESPKNIPSILSFGKVIADGATNIVPSEVRIEGTLRTMDEKWRLKVHSAITNIAKETCKAMGGDCEIEIRKGYPSVNNDIELTRITKQLTEQYLGVNNVVQLNKRMTTDDFAYFSQIIPSVFFRMGAGFEGIDSYSLHSPSFVANGDILKYSPGLLAWISINLHKLIKH